MKKKKKHAELRALVKAVQMWFESDEQEDQCKMYKIGGGYESYEARAIRRMDKAMKKAKKILK